MQCFGDVGNVVLDRRANVNNDRLIINLGQFVRADRLHLGILGPEDEFVSSNGGSGRK